MKKEKIKVALILSFLSATTSAQIYWRELATTSVKKSEVGQLNNLAVSAENVNLSTGVVTPKISITNIGTNFLQDEINLVYTKGSGVKINDISSDLGLGWDLESGGTITRKVNGFPDDSKIYTDASVGVEGGSPSYVPNGQKLVNGWLDYGNWNSKTKIINGKTYALPGTPYEDKSLGATIQEFALNAQNNIYNTKFRSLLAQQVSGPFNIGSGLAIADLGAIAGMGWDTLNVDGEPDEFYFNFGKYSGKFVFDGNRTPTTIPHIPGLKIESPFNSPGNQWIFTTPEGVKYYFSNTPSYRETSYSETLTAPLYDDCFGVTPNTNEGIDANEYISKWHLSKVEGSNGDFIEYSYETAPDLVYSENSSIKQVFKAGQPSLGFTTTPPYYFIDSADPGFYEREISRNTTYRIKSPKRISAITTSDNNKVLFNYNGLEREDIDQSQNASNPRKSLSAIEKYDYNGKLIEKFTLDQSYFQGSCNTYECKRLKLNSIRQVLSQTETADAVTGFEYNMTQNLPQRNSYLQDFWGYYNNNTNNSTPTLIPTVLDISFYGANRAPDEARSQANILTKIIYPTKGSIEYAYELNDFRTLPVNGVYSKSTTGGLRIKNIIKKESAAANPIVTSYIYKLDNGDSSGVLPNYLLTQLNNTYGAGKLYDRQTVEVDENDGTRSKYNMIYSNPKYIKSGNPLHYSKVIVKTLGKGETEYNLTTAEYPNNTNDKMISRKWQAADSHGTYIANSSYITDPSTNQWPLDPDDNHPTISITESANKGLIVSEKIRDESGNVLSETINDYQRNPNGFSMKTIYGVGVSSPDTFIAERSAINTVYFHINKYYNEYYFLKTKTKKEYLGGKAISTIQNFDYNTDGFIKQESTQHANNDITEEQYSYPADKQIQKLINANIVGEVVEKQSKNNNTVTKKVEKKYEITNNLLPSSVSTYMLDTPGSFKNITVDRYDAKGNQLQVTAQDNIPVTTIWGYKGTLPIAIIKGATYSQVMQAFGLNGDDNNSYLQLEVVKKSDLDIDDATEDTLISELNSFRTKPEFKNFEITTYTYNPLVGVTSICASSGIREHYMYDSANKLKEIREQNRTGRILTEYKYNYKN